MNSFQLESAGFTSGGRGGKACRVVCPSDRKDQPKQGISSHDRSWAHGTRLAMRRVTNLESSRGLRKSTNQEARLRSARGIDG